MEKKHKQLLFNEVVVFISISPVSGFVCTSLRHTLFVVIITANSELMDAFKQNQETVRKINTIFIFILVSIIVFLCFLSLFAGRYQ